MPSKEEIAEEKLFKTFKGSWPATGINWLSNNWQNLLLGISVLLASYFALDYFSLFDSSGQSLVAQYQKEIEESNPGDLYSIYWRMLQEDKPEVIALATNQLLDEDPAKRDNMTLAFENASRHWKTWPIEKSHQQVLMVAREFAQSVPKMQTPQQRMAINLTRSFLLWPKSKDDKANIRLLSYSDKVLRSSDLNQTKFDSLATNDENRSDNSLNAFQEDFWSPNRPGGDDYSSPLVAGSNQQSGNRRITARNASVAIGGTGAGLKSGGSPESSSSSGVKFIGADGQELSILPVDPTKTRNLTGGHIGVRITKESGFSSSDSTALPFSHPKPLNQIQDQAGQNFLNKGPGSDSGMITDPNLNGLGSSSRDRTNWSKLKNNLNPPHQDNSSGSSQIPGRNPVDGGETLAPPTVVPAIPGQPIPANPIKSRQPIPGDLIAKVKITELSHIDVMKLLRSPASKVVERATTELRRRGFQGTDLVAARKIVSTDPMTRLQLANQLEYDSSTISLPFLKHLAKDTNKEVQKAAIRILKNHRDKDAQRFAMKIEMETTRLPDLSER